MNSLTRDDYIDVWEKPVASFDVTPEKLDDINNTAQFFSTSTGNINSYLWTFGDGGSSWEVNPKHTYQAPGNYQVQLMVTSDLGCKDTIIDYLRYQEVLFVYVPNSFTPNGDGRNDIFKPKFQGSLQLYTLRIYDRWGDLVFETRDVNQGWVGDKLGSEYYVPDGVYTYVLEYEAWGGGYEEAVGDKVIGTITLLR